MQFIQGAVFVLASVSAVARAGLAPFITPCLSTDSTCIRTSAQKAVPVLAAGLSQLDVKPLDPLLVDRVKASQAGLDMDFRNTVVKGFRKCQVLNARRHSKKMDFDFKCSVTLVGDYTLGGKLLVFPIEGNGKFKIKIRDIVVKIVFDIAEVQTNGQTHWHMPSWKHTADVQTGAEFHFQNLFNGNKQLSDSIHQFANANWRDIFHEVAPPIVEGIVSKIMDVTNSFFAKVPKKELSLD